MFERFTDRARRVVVLAQEEARILNHNYIGTEHLLLGLLHIEDDPVAEILTELGCGLVAARDDIERILGEGADEPSGHIPFTPRAKKVLELSLRESLTMGDSFIGTEHILLGLVKEGEGVANQVFVELGVSTEVLVSRVLERLQHHDPEPFERKRPSFRGVEVRAALEELHRRVEALEIRLTAVEDRLDR
ncbi:hypothetical protein GCM10027589_09470 [Actinocorallia lasiicapitis]